MTFDCEDTIEEVIKAMEYHPFSQFPVYKGKVCIGLLTTRGIVSWMANHVARSIVDLTNSKVESVLHYENHHPIAFIPKQMNIFEVEDTFAAYHKRKEELEAVIITENGRNDETPLGMITAWDLIEIDYTID